MEGVKLQPGCVVRGAVFSEPVQVHVVEPLGDSLRLIGAGLHTGLVVDRILTSQQVDELTVSPQTEPFDGDATLFRLGVEAHRLGLAHEYDPYFSLSIARVDPLPHQLEAVYEYFLPARRVRFLLADDPGAGKTIMAGLLLKELKARGLVQRTLIIAPANLTFQWQREMKDKFREDFTVVRGEILRSQYGQNPWQELDQAVTSVSWVSRVDDARESLLRSQWDLVVVDEAHKMSAASEDHKTLAYQLGEAMSERSDHLLLMTATPHKGDPKHFCMFLRLLDKDVYADISSLQDAMERGSAPCYLRRTKETLRTFPDPETGAVRPLFTERVAETVAFQLDGDELEFYDSLRRFVEDQSARVAGDGTARGRAIGFTMAMLQRRMASSIYAVRRSLERMAKRRQDILADPAAWRAKEIKKRLPDDFDDLTDEEQQELIAELEDVVVSYDPADLQREIAQLNALVAHATQLQDREIETKLVHLRGLLTNQGIFDDPQTKLLIFTEHKDTLDYLAGDGRDGRPVGKLLEWGLTVTQIHGGMKIGDRDAANTRIWAEREFREQAQVLVATEAAGEGINLQFCRFMVNYDIPWNPVRLEQRIGRIHRYGQKFDCLIFNFAATNTVEGRVLAKLLDRLREIREELGSDQVFDVVGEVFPANRLDQLFREIYARQADVQSVEERIVHDLDPERFRRITQSTLEGLAKRSLNLQAIVGKSIEARERRLVPEVVEDFVIRAAQQAGLSLRPVSGTTHLYQIGRVPRSLWRLGETLEPRFGRLAREYGRAVFDQAMLKTHQTAEWITPGHPLFEVVRAETESRASETLRRGAVFYDFGRTAPACLDVFAASIRDGRDRTLHRRLFVVETAVDGGMQRREPTIFHDLMPATEPVVLPSPDLLPALPATEAFLLTSALQPFLTEVCGERLREIEAVEHHVRVALEELINRRQIEYAQLEAQQESGRDLPGLSGRLAMAEQRLEELNHRLESRLAELALERNLTIGDIQRLGRAWVVPHPERGDPSLAPMVRDDAVERIAVETAIAHERARGWEVESVEALSRGYDLLSRRPNPANPTLTVEVRHIEVKGRSGVGEVALSANEHRTAVKLGQDFWLYVVYNCGSTPELHTIQDPARLDWKAVVRVEHFIAAPEILRGAGG